MINKILSNFGHEKLNAQKAKLAFFILMATVDGKTDEMEVGFLMDRAQTYGVSKSEMQDLIAKVDNRAALFSTPETNGGKVEFVRDLAQMVLIDGEIHPEEVKYGNQLCDKMGFQAGYFEKLIRAEKKRSEYFEREWSRRTSPTQQDYREIMFQAIQKYPVQ